MYFLSFSNKIPKNKDNISLPLYLLQDFILNDTARQPTTVENTHQHVDINQPVQDSAKQHEKQIDNPHFGHDNTTAVNATIDKQEVITSANTPVDNNIDDHLNQQSQQADHADLATADKDITPPKTISIYEPNLTLPDNSLWIVNKDTDKNYIIETDPNFTQRKKWLSSDYMLSRLKADPDSVLKRLGDGYYEQQLIKEQIVGLTGHRYLQGYENDLAQYQALMDAGISFANQYGIAPGVELSAEQMKALTTDMVLLVKKQVVINNQAIDVLVPQVYIVNRTELSHDGALIAGDNVFIKGQALNSSGLINAKKDIQLSGNNVTNSGTVFGERVAIDAKNDITNYGKLVGDKLVYLSADNDINLLSSTRTQIRGNNAGKGPTANKPLDKTDLELQHGKGNVEQGGGNYKETKDKILDNQAANQKANESSKFGEHVAKEQEINAENGTTATTGKQEAIIPNNNWGALDNASKTAFDAAKNNVTTWTPKDKHMVGTTANRSA